MITYIKEFNRGESFPSWAAVDHALIITGELAYSFRCLLSCAMIGVAQETYYVHWCFIDSLTFIRAVLYSF